MLMSNNVCSLHLLLIYHYVLICTQIYYTNLIIEKQSEIDISNDRNVYDAKFLLGYYSMSVRYSF